MCVKMKRMKWVCRPSKAVLQGLYHPNGTFSGLDSNEQQDATAAIGGLAGAGPGHAPGQGQGAATGQGDDDGEGSNIPDRQALLQELDGVAAHLFPDLKERGMLRPANEAAQEFHDSLVEYSTESLTEATVGVRTCQLITPNKTFSSDELA